MPMFPREGLNASAVRYTTLKWVHVRPSKVYGFYGNQNRGFLTYLLPGFACKLSHCFWVDDVLATVFVRIGTLLDFEL